jgi:predicted Zn-dependent protease
MTRPAAALTLALGLLAACRSSPRDPADYSESADRPERIPARELGDLRRARAAIDAGDLEAARAILEPLASASPGDLSIAVMLQETRLAAATAEEQAALIEEARELAAGSPSTRNLLLAARVEPDLAAARELARRALAGDPGNPWCAYALAHLEARAGSWRTAQEHLARALELDPGHRAARRLEAMIVARAGRTQDAIEALELWVDVTRDDPRVSSSARVLAQLDLAHLLVVAREDERAREVLAGLAGEPLEQARRWCLLAAVEQALGRPQEALEAARAAAAADPGSVTPLVQEALLHQHHLDDPEAARAAWRKVLASLEGDTGLGALIQALRARVELERGRRPAP